MPFRRAEAAIADVSLLRRAEHAAYASRHAAATSLPPPRHEPRRQPRHAARLLPPRHAFLMPCH